MNLFESIESWMSLDKQFGLYLYQIHITLIRTNLLYNQRCKMQPWNLNLDALKFRFKELLKEH